MSGDIRIDTNNPGRTIKKKTKILQRVGRTNINENMKTQNPLLFIVILLTASINIFAQTADEWIEMGNLELDNTNYSKAIEYYQKAIEVDTNSYDAYHNLGIAYSIIQEYDKAIEYYYKVIQINDSYAYAYFALGNV